MGPKSAPPQRDAFPRKALLALATATLAALLACASAPEESRREESPEPPRPRQGEEQLAAPRLWQGAAAPAASGGAQGSLFLLGSIHVGPPGGWEFAPYVEEAFAAADVLVVEADLEAQDPEARDDATLRYGLLATDESLSQRIPPELYAALRARLEELGQPIMGLDRLEPWMVAIALTAMEIELAGYSPESGVDLQLMRRARGHKEIVGLETAREQLAMLDGLPAELQSLMLRDVLLHGDDMQGFFLALMEAWRRGDQAALERLVFRELEAHPELSPFYETIIFQRNETMAAKLAALASSGRRVFAVVGAAHMAGERGIPAQLGELGMALKVVPAAPSR